MVQQTLQGPMCQITFSTYLVSAIPEATKLLMPSLKQLKLSGNHTITITCYAAHKSTVTIFSSPVHPRAYIHCQMDCFYIVVSWCWLYVADMKTQRWQQDIKTCLLVPIWSQNEPTYCACRSSPSWQNTEREHVATVTVDGTSQTWLPDTNFSKTKIACSCVHMLKLHMALLQSHRKQILSPHTDITISIH